MRARHEFLLALKAPVAPVAAVATMARVFSRFSWGHGPTEESLRHNVGAPHELSGVDQVQSPVRANEFNLWGASSTSATPSAMESEIMGLLQVRGGSGVSTGSTSNA